MGGGGPLLFQEFWFLTFTDVELFWTNFFLHYLLSMIFSHVLLAKRSQNVVTIRYLLLFFLNGTGHLTFSEGCVSCYSEMSEINERLKYCSEFYFWRSSSSKNGYLLRSYENSQKFIKKPGNVRMISTDLDGNSANKIWEKGFDFWHNHNNQASKLLLNFIKS